MQVAQEDQITERFTRAIEQLGSEKMEIRLGGIYALERIANDSDKDYWAIMETLTAYVRERAPWREPPIVSNQPATGNALNPPIVQEGLSSIAQIIKIKPATDIQAILTILGRRKYRFLLGEERQLNLCQTDLRWNDLSRSHLAWALLLGTNLEGAFLWGAHLEMASLRFAHLERVDLTGVHLEGADLTSATGLTREQLAEAIIDDKTKLPNYLQEEPPEEKGPEGNGEE